VSRKNDPVDDDRYETDEVYPRPPRRRGCWGWLILLAALAVGGGGMGAVLLSVIGQPNSIRVRVEPDKTTLAVNESFTVKVTVENVDLEAVTLAGIGLEESLTGGLRVEGTEPPYRTAEAREYPVFGKWTEYRLDQTLLGGEKLVFTFTLTATQPGAYSGDVTAWIEDSLLGQSFERGRHAKLEFRVQ